MARKNIQQLAYTAIRIEGGLIPAEELARLTTLNTPDQSEQTERHYGIPKGLKLRDEIARNFKIAQNLWQDFQQLRQRKDVDTYGVSVREFLSPLLRHALGYTDLVPVAGIQTNNSTHHSYPIGHAALNGRLPIVMASHDQPLDQPSDRFGDKNPDTGRTRRRSPYMLAQEALNASDASLWALVSNGLTLRILRDNPSLTRPAYIEVDLEAIFTEELYADFTAFWLLAHASRFGEQGTEPADCPWERWRHAGQQAGVTVRQNLRYQVADALRSLGTGFLRHPANTTLWNRLHDPEEGNATKQVFFEELLSLVYRFIFLATVEDRTDPSSGRSLVFVPNAAEEVQQRYWTGYSLTWLRERAARRSTHDTHGDLWQALSITFDGLATGQPALGLPALGGIFAAEQCSLLDGAQIDNRHLLGAVFQLGYFRQPTGLTRVNYRDMGAEELGSVYESLLELVPDLQDLGQPHVAKFSFVGDDDDASNKGNARKLSGSYYTPDSLVQELIKSALEPVIEQTVKDAPGHPVEALLQVTVCDPACGSGHFLLAAARRLADEVAKLRAVQCGSALTPADYRHALRDVVGHCIYGVDKNPMAIELAKTALWLEAYTPDRPLTFIDHHLQVGDALLGVLDPDILENGIPDEAFAALSGDDKATAAALRKQNKADLRSWKRLAANDLFTASPLVSEANVVEHLADDTLGGVAAKRSAWQQAHSQAQQSTLARLTDTYLAAFLATKAPEDAAHVPLSNYLWELLHSDSHGNQSEKLGQAMHDLCRTHSVFHWWLAFPQVAARGGFSVMLGNPPWEVSQLSEEEFFAARAPSIAALSGDKRKKAIASLEEEQPWLWNQYQAAKRGYEATNLFYRASGRYPLSAIGKLNTYRLFAETIDQLTSLKGCAGFIVPTGIATDDTAKVFFGSVVQRRRLNSLVSFYEVRRWFPATDERKPFCLFTLADAEEASFIFDVDSIEDLSSAAKWYKLSADDFKSLNPNTRTLPTFRSQRDAELTKKLYGAAPILLREAVVHGEGQDAHETEPEVNPWGISFSQGLFNMTSASALFTSGPAPARKPVRLPLYEGKLIHQFDHRLATFLPDPAIENDDWESRDVTLEEKAVPSFSIATRYWVGECEVLSRIARVPTRVASAWLGWRNGADALVADEFGTDDSSVVTELRRALTLALASWVAGALFRYAMARDTTIVLQVPQTASLFGESPEATRVPNLTQVSTNSDKAAVAAMQMVEQQLATRFPILANSLKGDGISGKKALAAFQKWANQDDPVDDLSLSEGELAELEALQRPPASAAEDLPLQFLDAWMERRSPRWLMGWRDVTNAAAERTVIATVVPRAAVGHTMPLFFTHQPVHLAAALLGNWCSLTLDYLARQKVGGTHLTYGYLKQLPVLPPDRYAVADLGYIVPRVLELTHTAHDMQAWADDVLASFPNADQRPGDVRGTPLPPFPWNSERRAQLRAELDAYYAYLYGLTRDELCYVLDPADVMGEDYPSETFRVLKKNELNEFGEYRTRRLVLEAWDRLEAVGWRETPALASTGVQYSSIGVIQSVEEAKFAGLVAAIVGARPEEGITTAELQSVVARWSVASEQLDATDAQRLVHLLAAADWLQPSEMLNRVLPIVQRLETAGVVVRKRTGSESRFFQGDAALPADVVRLDEHDELARLLLAAETRRLAAQTDNVNTQGESHRAQGM